MKKLMFLLIILAMVNVANAGIIDIAITSLNGEPITPTNKITINPTDEVDLSIMWTAPDTEYLFALGVTINVQGPGTLMLDPEGIVAHADFDPTLEVIDPVHSEIIEAASWLGPQGMVEPIDVVWNILLHCDGEGDVIVWLTDDRLINTIVVNGDFDELPYEYSAAITIHQIPEPMTLTLLGLGGLVLLRRRK